MVISGKGENTSFMLKNLSMQHGIKFQEFHVIDTTLLHCVNIPYIPYYDNISAPQADGFFCIKKT